MKKLIGIFGIIAVLILASSLFVVADTDTRQQWIDAINQINAQWTLALQEAVVDAYQKGYREGRMSCNSGPNPTPTPDPEVESLIGDIDGDGCVDGLDLTRVAGKFGCIVTDSDNCGNADINGNGEVDIGDTKMLEGNWQRGCAVDGDYTGDGCVNQLDLNWVISEWGDEASGPEYSTVLSYWLEGC